MKILNLQLTFEYIMAEITAFLRFLKYEYFWKHKPGIVILVKWPRNPNSDPNEVYRPYLEQHIGRQKQHWDWKLQGNDIMIKICRSKARYANLLILMWN